MSRVPDIVPEKFNSEHRALYDRIMAGRPDGKLQGPSALWIRDAKLAAAAHQMAGVLRKDGKLEAPLFELITLIVARQWTAQYVWVVHAKEAERAGLESAIIEAIRARRVPPRALSPARPPHPSALCACPRARPPSERSVRCCRGGGRGRGRRAGEQRAVD